LAERIHDRDKLYDEMVKAYYEIDSLIGDDIILGYLFVCCYPIEDIAKQLDMSVNKVKQQLYERLDRLDL
jgi:Sigma-70, region 4.